MANAVVQINTGNLTNAFLVRGHTGCILVDTGNPVGSAQRERRRRAGDPYAGAHAGIRLGAFG